MTKTEYREYLGSPKWQEKRKKVFANKSFCANCEIPRWLAEIVYDQDLNVHHVSYSNVGREKEDDLEPLCRRCHEIEKFGRSDLREPKSTYCEVCGHKHWNRYSDKCELCRTVTATSILRLIYSFENKIDRCGNMTVIDFLIMLSMIHHEGIESMLKSMRKLEPLVKRSLEKTAHPEPVDVPF